MTLTAAEQELAAKLGFDEEVLLIVKREFERDIEPYERYVSPIDGSEEIVSSSLWWDDNAFGVLIGEEPGKPWYLQWHEELVCRVRHQLAPYGYIVYSGEDDSYRPTLVIIKSLDPYDILRNETLLRAWDLDHNCLLADGLIDKIKDWQARHNVTFDIIGAASSNIKLRFETYPRDMVAFARDVHYLCWEIQDQIYQLGYNIDDPSEVTAMYQALADVMKRDGRVFLWWD